VIPNAGTMALLRRLLFFKERFDMATTLPSVWAFIEPIDIAKVLLRLRPLRRGRFLLPHAFPSVTLVWSDNGGPTAPTMVQLGTLIVWGDVAKPPVFDIGWRLCCMG
jgi:hypothetical protein